jgi:hypothetical protein
MLPKVHWNSDIVIAFEVAVAPAVAMDDTFDKLSFLHMFGAKYTKIFS